MSAFRKPFRCLENQVESHVVDVAAYMRPQALAQRPTPVAPPPTVEQQLEAARVAIRALLQHGRRPDIVLQAEHVLALSGGRA